MTQPAYRIEQNVRPKPLLRTGAVVCLLLAIVTAAAVACRSEAADQTPPNQRWQHLRNNVQYRCHQGRAIYTKIGLQGGIAVAENAPECRSRGPQS